MWFHFCRNRDSLKNGTLISIRRTGDGFHPGLFIQKIEVDKDGNVDIYLRIFGDLGLDETVLISDNQT